ncbi:serine/threonine protein kinase [Loktanella sp. D2R18]|uniref:serine/threonine-protein kinase n=1 Tax=Rhodobacterales TaxID=204455 RepID=UPI000DEB5B0D|nr:MULTISPECIES: serine/threonine-protein kinase [Rhodobacterales]MDO6590429.1 serine/threonine-protein kinase [Yoonia sp. 1_MG-2023]RBW41152.1 serine/threonine protein kinase [Loktanella sp. D2R18]
MTTAAPSKNLTNSPTKGEALPNGTALLGDQFTIKRRLGNGGFGITYLAQDNYLGRNVVVKECYPEVFCRRDGKSVYVRSDQHYEKYRSIVTMFMREARTIAKMRHPNIVGVHRIFEDNDTAYMVLDLIEGRDLLDIIKKGDQKLKPQQVQEIMIKLLDAVDTVHRQDLLHRDISPDNILLDKWGSPVLIDFGAAREEASRETRELSAVLVVKDGYSPQEFYFAGGKQSPSSDLYALGASFYHLISGKAPPNSQTRMAEFAGQNPDPCVPLAGRFDEYDPAFLAAIDKAMNILPKDRLQSAREWSDLIDGEQSERITPLILSQPDNLGQSLTRLVSETNEYVRKSQTLEQRPRERKIETPVKQIPNWVLEFNEESSKIVNSGKTRAQSPAQAAPTYTPPGLQPAQRRSRIGMWFMRRFSS